MKALKLALTVITGSYLLNGCAVTPNSEAELGKARVAYERLKDDANVLRSAPKDLIRAGESLGRAERLSSYWGSSDDVAHYAYLSQQYAAIAEQKSLLNLNQEKAAKLELDKQRLELALREAKLLNVQDQGSWIEEQIVSLASDEANRGLVMTLGDMLFDTGHSDLQISANRTVLKLVQFLQLNPRRVVRIEGYTDNTGTAEENLQLSNARAQAVADVMVELGIDPKRIEVKGYGDSFPVAVNASEKGRAQNRRVEVVISDENGRLSESR
ncbi:OmpA family protein [Ectopseudomonas mendocina]|uniref:OmpA family protein n=1 Tax=Ectopseudomonas mendocina TaxID=300 RepID=A0ABZ2RE38_ECTME